MTASALGPGCWKACRVEETCTCGVPRFGQLPGMSEMHVNRGRTGVGTAAVHQAAPTTIRRLDSTVGEKVWSLGVAGAYSEMAVGTVPAA